MLTTGNEKRHKSHFRPSRRLTFSTSVLPLIQIISADQEFFREGIWQARRESNPQPPVLETGALPIELLAYILFKPKVCNPSELLGFGSRTIHDRSTNFK